MAFRQCFFFDTPEETKIVLLKVIKRFMKTPNCTCWPKELNQKDLPLNIQYRTRPNGRLPSIFLSFATEWMLKNLKGSLSIFVGILKLFKKHRGL